ncbi:RidA family protein [Cellulomonas cellasea]|uniref:Endoribonuclease n=2 Tax=Cellulomonas cellasea TaxID=43670 RepID=A0A0A0BAJ4_9CELL|nr:RidA family protein [Cellulomonas cellasea]KGM03198.1 endoribonuclease [Cellulomonas cellasea DSM 20118]GEA89805.1 enamine deaminase RidA [Cellulomonas cellasea]
MAVTLRNPDGLPKPDFYHQVAVATGSRLVFVAGQLASGPDGALVGVGELAAQVEQCYLNLGTALADAGATFADVVKLTVYVADPRPDQMPQFFEGISRAAERLGVTPQAPLTGIFVAGLADPDALVEIEATAVVD